MPESLSNRPAPLYRVTEVAALLAVDRRTVYRMAEDGRLPSVRFGGNIRIPREPVHELLNSWTEDPAAQAAAG